MPGTRQGNRKGTYVVFMTLPDDSEINVGSLGRIFLKAGDYCYVGSAMNGLDQRVRRHLSNQKNIRWHIDYITSLAINMEAYVSECPGSVPECKIAEVATSLGFGPTVKGFGSSDCRCYCHLLSVPDAGKISLVESLGMKPLEPIFACAREWESL